MNHITKIDLEKSIDNNKKKGLSLLDRYFYRPIAEKIITIILFRSKFSPNIITLFSMLIVLLGGILLSVELRYLNITGIILFHFFMVLDCMDGSYARVLKSKYNISNPEGAYYDALGGYFFIFIFNTSLGFNLYLKNNNIEFIIISLFTVIFSLFSRINFIKHESITSVKKKSKERDGLLIKIYRNFDWGGFLLPIYLLLFLLDKHEYLIFYNLILSILMNIWLFIFLYNFKNDH